MREESQGQEGSEGRTGSSGELSLRLAAGTYRVGVSGEELAAEFVWAKLEPGRSTAVHLLVMPSAALTVRVVDGLGQGLSGARVAVECNGGYAPGHSGTTGDGGFLVLERLLPAAWFVTASAPGFSSEATTTELGRLARPPVVISLSPLPDGGEDDGQEERCSIVGRVTDDTGTPLELPVSARCGDGGSRTESNTDGTFSLRGLPLAPCTVTVAEVSHAVQCPGEVALELRTRAQLEISVEGLEIAQGQMTDTRVWLMPASGRLTSVFGQIPALFTHVAEGRARFYVQTPEGAASGEVGIPSGGVTRVTTWLGAGGASVSGRVVHARSGTPLRRVNVQLPVPHEDDVWPHALAVTGEDGRFTFLGATAGKGSVCVHRAGFLVRCFLRDLAGGLDLGEVRLEPGDSALPSSAELGVRWVPAPGGALVEEASGAAAALRVGDLVVAIDGAFVDGLGEDDLSALLGGPQGTPVQLEVRREGQHLKVLVPR
jgi:hypothetical protein